MYEEKRKKKITQDSELQGSICATDLFAEFQASDDIITDDHASLKHATTD